MGQRYGNMVASDGSQAFFTNMPANVVLVASPTNMQQMGQGMQQMGQGMQQVSYAMPQMMSAPMQPQMMMAPMQPQDQSGNNFQNPQYGVLEEAAKGQEQANGVDKSTSQVPTECQTDSAVLDAQKAPSG